MPAREHVNLWSRAVQIVAAVGLAFVLIGSMLINAQGQSSDKERITSLEQKQVAQDAVDAVAVDRLKKLEEGYQRNRSDIDMMRGIGLALAGLVGVAEVFRRLSERPREPRSSR